MLLSYSAAAWLCTSYRNIHSMLYVSSGGNLAKRERTPPLQFPLLKCQYRCHYHGDSYIISVARAITNRTLFGRKYSTDSDTFSDNTRDQVQHPQLCLIPTILHSSTQPHNTRSSARAVGHADHILLCAPPPLPPIALVTAARSICELHHCA